MGQDGRRLLIEPHYLPSWGYFSLLAQYDEIVWEVSTYYEKQSYKNRCYISASQGLERMVVPVRHRGRKQLLKEVRVDYSEKWHIGHMRSLMTAYGKAPYFMMIEECFFPVLKSQPTFLVDLNILLIEKAFHCLGWHKKMVRTEGYKDRWCGDDYRDMIHPKRELQGIGKWGVPRYKSMFDLSLSSRVSIIDGIACEGDSLYGLL